MGDDETVDLEGETVSKRPHISALIAAVFGDGWQTEDGNE